MWAVFCTMIERGFEQIVERDRNEQVRSCESREYERPLSDA